MNGPKAEGATRRLLLGREGFTLIEIMVVVIILGILGALVVPKVLERPEQARRVRAKTEVATIGQALDLYKLDNGFYPTTEQGLQALVQKPSGGGPVPQNWNPEGYLPNVPIDPWGKEYVYLYPGAHGSGFDLESFGQDGIDGGEGPAADVESWNMHGS
ncbi:MAG: type II secretion system major pseudopilin GspG [Candidatus Methylomirabilis sp.]|nr:type II secretion system major pseudopilin GspG [Deltaproteobacteria bacterium]